MNISKVYAVYFSPTGTTDRITSYVAEEIAARLNVKCIKDDFSLPALRQKKRKFKSDELVVFGVPTYAGRVPNKVLPFVQELFEGDCTPLVPVVTFGNRAFDDSLNELRDELSARGFYAVGAAAGCTRHVLARWLAPERPDEEDFKVLDGLVEAVSGKLQNAACADELSGGIDIRGNKPVGPYYKPLQEDGSPANFLKAKPKTNMDRCNNCGKCAMVCTMGSISMDDFTEVPGICIKCNACVNKCPKGAKYFDDPVMLSHLRMLEDNFQRRAETEIFV